ncbi:MAG: HAMP domain-containing sensor histidine kinase [Spirochaetia bacterium]|nr:HAMP domain-containing histidine kinase [Spirochaetota bacterium]MDW8112137.1 HAMP domain-containing sensor histidine kinase [Spirochaetia bacterium]
MVRQYVLISIFIAVILITSVIISEWVYTLSFGAVNRVSNFVVVSLVVVSFFTSILLIFKSVRDLIASKLGSRIRLRLIVLFVFTSSISSIILSTIFVSTVDAIRSVNETREGERVSQMSREILKHLSVFYKDMFVEIETSLDKPSKGVKVLTISGSTQVSDKVEKEIINQVLKTFATEGKSIIVVDDKEYGFVFRRDRDYKVAYKQVDNEIYEIKKGISKILQVSSNSEFIFYDIFGNYFLVILILLNIPSLFVSILIAYLFAEYVSTGISRLSEGMNELSKGNLQYKISEKWAVDEVRDLIKNFNIMTLKLLEAQYRVSKMEKMELWKDIARKIAHEIKNPLTPIKLSIQRLLLDTEKENFKQKVVSSLSLILEEVDRIDNLITQLSNFAKIPQPNPSNFSFTTIVESLKSLFSEQGIEIEYIVEGDDNIYADFDQIKQCLINLVKNGIDASQGLSNRITIKFSRKPESCVISVRDYGVGIPDDMKDKILKPYITTKKTGSGLGLSIVETIVINHNGKLYFDSAVGKGSEFFIEIPSSY